MDKSDKFLRSVADNLTECFAKIGYTEAPVTFNYPKATLKTLFGEREMSDAALAEKLSAAIRTAGGMTYAEAGDLVLLTVGKERVRQFHETNGENPFLSSLVALAMTPGAGREETHALFRSGGRSFAVLPAPDGEFDEVLFFTEGEDEYRYCMEYDAGRVEYHRLLKEDYEEIFGK